MNFPNTYELIKEQNIEDIKNHAYLLRHKKSGARVLVMDNDDENKVFAIGFRTPVSNSTGVPHILEHSVLCGSKKYPVTDPFLHLAKSSLNTFLNALTFPDKTLYPVASCNDKDLTNLMSVYLDAVFYPNIHSEENIFKQEGWRYELESAEDDLKLNGVVYSEMKGCFSDPDSVLERYCLNSLYPDTSYGYESGGDPEEIPSLTYEEFKNFHKKYYHPSNSYIYLYGDMNFEERLEFIDREYLSNFDKLEVDSRIKKQESFDKIREYKIDYPIAEGEDTDGESWLSLQWSVDDLLNNELYYAMQVIDYALLAAEGSPLREALLKGGIGEDVFGGYMTDMYQPMFKLTVKNTDQDKKDSFLGIVEDTLKKVVHEGFDKRSLKAAINNMSFKIKEADFGGYPKGLIYLFQALESWLYNDDEPVMHLEYSEVFDIFNKKIEEGYFEKIVEKYLLNNNHKSLVALNPVPGLATKREEDLKDKLATYKKSLSDAEIDAIVADTKQLKAWQSKGNTPEDLATLPHLELDDLCKTVKKFTVVEDMLGEIPFYYQPINTNGITYAFLTYAVDDFTKDELMTLGLLREIIGTMNTENFSYKELSDEVNYRTGGLDFSFGVREVFKGDKPFLPTFDVTLKFLHEKAEDAVELYTEIIKRTLFEDKERFIEVIKQLRSRAEMKCQGIAHTLAMIRMSSYYNLPDVYKEITTGISFVRYIGEITDSIDKNADEILANIKAVYEKVFDNTRLKIDITDDEEGVAIAKRVFGKDFSKGAFIERELCKDITLINANEAFTTTSQVNYVSMGGNYKKLGYEYSGSMHVLKSILSHDILWNAIRVKGGAYGALCNFTKSGKFNFVSYRDPNVSNTIEEYKKLGEIVSNYEASERDMADHIISVIGSVDQPLSPAAWGAAGYGLYISGVSEEERQRGRNQILSCTLEEVRSYGEMLTKIMAENNLCTIGSASKIESEKDCFNKVESLL